MVQMSDSDKVLKVIEALELNVNSFTNKLEYKSPSTVSHVIKGLNQLSDGMIVRIINKFPNVSYNFLKNGQGEVLLSEEEKINQTNFFNIGEPKSDMFDFIQLPKKIDKLIEQQEITNDLLRELLEQKKAR
jgi:plasmid maintenance system antidote protein VapI